VIKEQVFTHKMKKSLVLYILLSLWLSSCGIYSFTGASIHPDAKTFSVEYFKNNAPIFNPTLSQEITEMLQDKLSSQTSLKLTDGKGDLQFKGQIIDYSVSPVGLQAGETAAQNRLTIKVKVEFINEFQENYNFNETFTRYADYESSKILTSVESTLVPEILELITDDIFQKAVVNW
jgi:hypothetical protein